MGEEEIAKQMEKMLNSESVVKLREQIGANRFSMSGIKAVNKTRRVYKAVEIVNTASLGEMHRTQLKNQLAVTGDASLEAAGFNFAIVMDGSKVLYTPSGNVFSVPSHALALGIAAEWDSQHEFVRVGSMPLTQMSTTVIDMLSNPAERAKKIETMMDFVKSDSICYRSSQPPALVRLQEKHWDPLLAFMVYCRPSVAILALCSRVDCVSFFFFCFFQRLLTCPFHHLESIDHRRPKSSSALCR